MYIYIWYNVSLLIKLVLHPLHSIEPSPLKGDTKTGLLPGWGRRRRASGQRARAWSCPQSHDRTGTFVWEANKKPTSANLCPPSKNHGSWQEGFVRPAFFWGTPVSTSIIVGQRVGASLNWWFSTRTRDSNPQTTNPNHQQRVTWQPVPVEIPTRKVRLTLFEHTIKGALER